MVLKLYWCYHSLITRYERMMIFMMLIPRRNNFDVFDNFFRDDEFLDKRQPNLMKTDIKENDSNYIIEMDLPGFDKENIDLMLNDGYLEISAKMIKEENEDESEKYIRRERYYGECSRSFYVGEDILEEDIDAEFKNGILKVTIPKKEETKKLSESKRIEIK